MKERNVDPHLAAADPKQIEQQAMGFAAAMQAAEEADPGSLHDEYKEMMQRRDVWTDEMRETHERRKEAVDSCLLMLAGLDANDRYIVKDRLRDIFDLEDGELDPSALSAW